MGKGMKMGGENGGLDGKALLSFVFLRHWRLCDRDAAIIVEYKQLSEKREKTVGILVSASCSYPEGTMLKKAI